MFLAANKMKGRVIKKLIPVLLSGAMVVAAIPLNFTNPSRAAEENILKGKKTMCTYQGDSGHACKKAVDEKLTTSRWGSNNKTPQAIQIDMGAVYEIDTIKAYLFGKDRKYTYEYYVTMEPTIKTENGGNGSDNFVGKNPVVTGLQGVGYGWADPDGQSPTPESEIHSEDYTFKDNKPVGRYLTLRVTKCDHIVCVWDIQAFGKKVDDTAVKPKGDLILEAEKGALSGNCKQRDSANCSNGQYVGYIGEGAGNTITWKANVEKAGIYTVEAYFLSKQERALEVKVNDDAKTTLTCQAGVDWDSTVVKSNNTITVKLKAGENTIVIGNDEGEAPNLDCVALTFKEAIKETEPKETEPKETEPKETEPKETEPKETEPKETEPKETEPKETEPKETEPKESETQETEQQGTETENKESETQETEQQGTETENKESETQETEQPETETENKESETQETEQPTPETENGNKESETQGTDKPITEQPASVSKGDIYWYKNLKYKVTKADAAGKGTVELVSTKNKKIATVTIPATIKIEGQKYKVTSIGKNAFKNCRKLKKVVIKTTQLKKVGKNAFKGIKDNAKIKVPSSKLKKYKRLLKGKGQGKNVNIMK